MAEESVETTYEEASRCNKCKQPAYKQSEKPAPRRQGITRGAMIHVFVCMNERCKWYNTVVRTIQVNPDGTIPFTPKRIKEFPQRPDLTREVQAAIDAQLARETSDEGGELRR